jgi:N-acetylglucosamine-6-sulfatase
VFVLSDEQDARSTWRMETLQKRVVEPGTAFRKAAYNLPLCCPSRATILRGQLAHNTQIVDNKNPTGGFRKFRHRHLDESTMCTWLDRAGYRTGYFGKLLNGFGDAPGSDTCLMPGVDRQVFMLNRE